MMPVAVESTADVRIAATSTFSMTYEYQMVNGHAVNGAPKFSRLDNSLGFPHNPAP